MCYGSRDTTIANQYVIRPARPVTRDVRTRSAFIERHDGEAEGKIRCYGGGRRTWGGNWLVKTVIIYYFVEINSAGGPEDRFISIRVVWPRTWAGTKDDVHRPPDDVWPRYDDIAGLGGVASGGEGLLGEEKTRTARQRIIPIYLHLHGRTRRCRQLPTRGKVQFPGEPRAVDAGI